MVLQMSILRSLSHRALTSGRFGGDAKAPPEQSWRYGDLRVEAGGFEGKQWAEYEEQPMAP